MKLWQRRKPPVESPTLEKKKTGIPDPLYMDAKAVDLQRTSLYKSQNDVCSYVWSINCKFIPVSSETRGLVGLPELLDFQFAHFFDIWYTWWLSYHIVTTGNDYCCCMAAILSHVARHRHNTRNKTFPAGMNDRGVSKLSGGKTSRITLSFLQIYEKPVRQFLKEH